MFVVLNSSATIDGKTTRGGGLKQHLRSNKTSNLASYIRSSRYLNKLAFLSAISAFALSFLMLNPPVLSNDEASATTGTATASTTSITLTSLDNSATVDLASLTPNGSFTTSTSEQSATFSLTTNNYTGYTLAIIANDDNGNLSTTVEPGDTPETISSISTITSTEDFSASTSTAAENYNNKWGFRPSKYVDATNNTVVDNTGDNPVYLPSPTTTPTLLDKTSTANTATANTYTLALGLRANQDTKAGTYTKTFNLVVTANPISYTINYNQNTVDTVTNMPTTQASDTSSTSITLTNTVPQRAHYSFIGWCNVQPTTNSGTDSCSGTTYNPNGAGTNLTYGIDQTTANTTTLYAMWKIDTFTCTKQYRLENADGTWGAYTTESTEAVNYGGSCSYTKTVTDYRGASNAANGAQGSASASNITASTTLSLDFYRNTYSLTVSAGTNTSSPTGSGTYRWGQTVTVGVTKATNVTCTSYSTPTWTATAGTAPAAGASTSFTMPTSNATITATSTASNVAQTITLSRSGGASGININNTNYTGSSVSLYCGTYNISGNYSSGYEFSSWSRANGVTVANTSSNSTTMTVSGAGTLSLAGKSSKLYLQNVTSATCPTTATTAYDSRDEEAYTIQKLADGKCWLLDNLRLDLSTTRNLTTANTNITSNWTAPTEITTWSNVYDAPKINAASKDTTQTYGSGSGKIGVYYNYCAATAGTYCYASGAGTGNATSDICPKGWRMPTGGSSGEYQALYTAYSSNATNFKNALRTPLSGSFYNGSALSQGSYGLFWSSTYNSSNRMYGLYVSSSDVSPQDSGGRYYGYSVRCVLQ